MTQHPTLAAALVTGVAVLAFAGAASGQSCAERATRLKTQVDALPSDTTYRELSQSLGVATGANDARCEEIVARAERELEAAGEGHASSEKPIPNYQNTPADPAAGPGMRDTAAGTDEEGHASPDDPIPNQPSGDAPAASGPGGADSTAGSTVDEGATGHASSDDPIPNQPSNADDDADPTSED